VAIITELLCFADFEKAVMPDPCEQHIDKTDDIREQIAISPPMHAANPDVSWSFNSTPISIDNK